MPHERELTPLTIVNAVLRYWRPIVAVPAALALVVGVWTISGPRTYVASATFLPQASDTRGPGGAAALAQQFGLSLGTDRAGESPQFYVNLLRRNVVLRQALESEYIVPGEAGGTRQVTLLAFLGYDDPSPADLRRALEELEQSITASADRETGEIRFRVSASDPRLAEQVAARLLEILDTFNKEVRRSRAREEGRFISERVTEAQAELAATEAALQDFLRSNRQFNDSPELMAEHDRLQRQVAMRQEVYTSLVRSQEQARIDAVRDTPVFTVIDHPAGMAEPEGRGTVRRALLAFVFGLMVVLIGAFLGEYNRRSREQGDADYVEFQVLKRRVLEDLRHPRRWVRGRDRTPVAVGDG